MARYDYSCTNCNHIFEVEHPMGEKPKVLCPICNKEAKRVFAASSIEFKGSGFYNTDQKTSCHQGGCAACEHAHH